MLVHEALGYDRYGRRYVSREEMEARRRFVLGYDFTKCPEHKPLKAYQDGKRSLPELVLARHEDEMKRLSEEYQDFFKWPESRQFQRYQQKKEKLQESYKEQKKCLDEYADNNRLKREVLSEKRQSLCMAIMFLSAGAANAAFSQIGATLLFVGAMIQFRRLRSKDPFLKKIDRINQRIHLILEDWYEQDPLARAERDGVNEKLEELNRGKPTQIRRNQKLDLVAEYRKHHPKTRV